MNIASPKQFLLDLFNVAVKRASPANCLPPYLENLPHQKIHVIGAGKAAASMAKTIEEFVEGETTGLVITRYGHALPVDSIEVVEAAHPVPDQVGVVAATRIIRLAESLGKKDFVICAISGGASSLLSLPQSEIPFETKQSITRQLLLAGANIQELNCVRKHLSAIKGGRLMRHIFPAHALTLCISDVVGDDPSVIGSGPTVADSSTCENVLDVLNRYQITVPKSILTMLKNKELETPKPDSLIFENSKVQIVAKPMDALLTSAAHSKSLGLETIMLGDTITGDSSQTAKEHAKLIRNRVAQGSQDKPFVILSGGETTVNVTGSGRGGPNSQYLLALALEIQGMDGVFAIACDTDGIDGSENNAGAIIGPSTLTHACEKNLDARQFLNNNDAYSFFERLSDLVTTGPTLTNVNDFRAIAYFPGSS